jgi:hypothetical protein
MKGTVNPFEPWRPVADRIPPPLHVSRPWRPPPPPPVLRAVEEPPVVEPVKPLPRNKPPERPKQPQPEPGQTARRHSPIPGWEWPLVLFVLLVMFTPQAIISCFAIGSHMPRAAVLGASAGIFAFMAFFSRRSWYTRLTWMAAALALAGIALWFVPTTHGVNLWSAYRQVEELRVLPAGAVAEYQRGAVARRTVVEDFPSFAADVKSAEQAWFRRTVDEAIENADRKLAKDPDAALTHLQQLAKELSQLEHYGSVQKDLKSARRRAVQACLKGAQQP